MQTFREFLVSDIKTQQSTKEEHDDMPQLEVPPMNSDKSDPAKTPVPNPS